MHELGHNLGLRHGGNEEAPNKPNYLSIMNYNYTLKGLEIDDVRGHLDYSRLRIAAVSEQALSEAAGFGPDPNGTTTEADLLRYGVFIYWGALDTAGDWIDTVTGGASINLDFNHNGSTQSGQIPAQSVNQDNDTGDTHAASQNDWDHLIFDGGQIGEGFEALSTAAPIECYPK